MLLLYRVRSNIPDGAVLMRFRAERAVCAGRAPRRSTVKNNNCSKKFLMWQEATAIASALRLQERRRAPALHCRRRGQEQLPYNARRPISWSFYCFFSGFEEHCACPGRGSTSASNMKLLATHVLWSKHQATANHIVS